MLVSGNFFNLLDQYYALEPKVDLIITEMRNTRYRQPAWYRYVAGFAGPKPVVVVENPYGGVVPELVANLKVGKGYDLFRMSLYEAAALGANMSVPYGAWLGSIEQDSFYPPHELCVEIQDFLADHERALQPADLQRRRGRLQHRERFPARRPARPVRQRPAQPGKRRLDPLLDRLRRPLRCDPALRRPLLPRRRAAQRLI